MLYHDHKIKQIKKQFQRDMKTEIAIKRKNRLGLVLKT